MALLITLLAGFWLPIVLLPLMLLFFIHKVNMNTFNFPKFVLYLFILLILFIVSYFLFWTDPVIPLELSSIKSKPIFVLFEFLFFTTFFYWFPFLTKKEMYLNVLYLFLIGMLVKSSIFTIYTFFEYPDLLLSRKVMDPFKNIIVNTPGLSNMSSLSFVLAFYMLINKNQSIKLILLNIFVILLALVTGIALEARTFFIILGIGVIGILIINNYKSSFIYIIAFLTIVFFLDMLLVSYSVNYEHYRDFLFSRFSTEGLSSERYNHWAFAVNEIQNHPFGGAKVDHIKEIVFWYHNLWLDIARTSGLLTLLLFVIYETLIVYVGLNGLYKKKREIYIYLLIYFLVVIIMFVSIPMEADLALFFLHIMLGSILLHLNYSKGSDVK